MKSSLKVSPGVINLNPNDLFSLQADQYRLIWFVLSVALNQVEVGQEVEQHDWVIHLIISEMLL